MLLLDSWQKVVTLRPGVERAVRAVTPIARRFVFDSEACTHVGRLLFEASDLVAEQIVFAKPPYDHTYIELSDARAMFKGWRPYAVNPPATSDNKLGMLYSHDKVYTMCSSDTSDIPPTIGMFSITVGHGQTTPLKEIFGDENPWTKFETNRPWQEYVKLAYLLGGMREPDGTIHMTRADYDYFVGHYDLGCTIAAAEHDYHRKLRYKTMFNAAFLGGGDILIGAACLLLIHGQQKGVSIQSVPHSRGWFKGKNVVFKTHGVVTIKLGKHDTMRKIVFGSRESPRRHDVMGTWVHYHREHHCDHDWFRLEDQDHERYQCRKCPTLRTWRASHARGDGSKGVKTKTYSVVE